MRPKRSIVFASWDAEEFTLTSSTEWGEQFEAMLKDKAIAYLNVDSSDVGAELHGDRGAIAATASSRRRRATVERSGHGRCRSWKRGGAAAASSRRSLPNAGGLDLVNNRLGSGSDYTVFLNFLGRVGDRHGV